jgi:DNA repair exonuclease SbcCD nuclease subunit
MRSVWVTDIHLKTTDPHGKIMPDGINSRLTDRINHIKQTVDHAIKIKADYWICLGDVFDKINPPEVLRNLFFDAIAPLFQAGIKVIIIIGNHDTDFRVHSFMADERFINTINANTPLGDQFKVIAEPTELDLNGTKAYAVPYDHPDEIAKTLAAYKSKAGTLLLGHFDVKGALVGGTEFAMTNGIPQSLMDGFRYSILGHYHKFQKTKKWMYIGSVSIVDWGEADDKKGFLQLDDTGKLKIEFIAFKERTFFHHKIFQVDDPDFSALGTWSDFNGHIVKLTFIGDEDWYLTFNKQEIKSKVLKTLGAHKLSIAHSTTRNLGDKHPEIDVSTSWVEGVEFYCKKKGKPDMLELGKEILQEVM